MRDPCPWTAFKLSPIVRPGTRVRSQLYIGRRKCDPGLYFCARSSTALRGSDLHKNIFFSAKRLCWRRVSKRKRVTWVAISSNCFRVIHNKGWQFWRFELRCWLNTKVQAWILSFIFLLIVFFELSSRALRGGQKFQRNQWKERC